MCNALIIHKIKEEEKMRSEMFSKLTSPNETKWSEKSNNSSEGRSAFGMKYRKEKRTGVRISERKTETEMSVVAFFPAFVVKCNNFMWENCVYDMNWPASQWFRFDVGNRLIGSEWIWQFLKYYYTLAESHAQTHLAGIEITCVFWQNLYLFSNVRFVWMCDDQSSVRSCTQTAKSLAI